EARLALVGTVELGLDLVRKLGDLVQQFARIGRALVVAERGDELDRLAQIGEVLTELFLHPGVQHRYSPNSSPQAGGSDGPRRVRWEGGNPAPSAFLRSAGADKVLDLADQIERGRERLSAFLPGRRADFTRVGADVLRGLDLANEFGCVAADAFAGDLHQLDHAIGIDHERGP